MPTVSWFWIELILIKELALYDDYEVASLVINSIKCLKVIKFKF